MNNIKNSFSSANGELWAMATFKVKYCHKIFDDVNVRQRTDSLFFEAFEYYGIPCRKLAFDSDHVHMILEMGLYSKPEIAKKLKGFVARKLFQQLPWLKSRRFWGSGLWNPAYDIRTGDMEFYGRYLDKQKYASVGQKTLVGFF